MLEKLREQARQYEVPLEAGNVESLRSISHVFCALVDTDELQARTVILATGIVDKKPSMTVRSGYPRDVVRYCRSATARSHGPKDRGAGRQEAAKKALFLRTFSRRRTCGGLQTAKLVDRLEDTFTGYTPAKA